MKQSRAYAVIILALVALLLGIAPAGAAGERVIVYGADLTPTGRQELAQIFNDDGTAKVDTVTTEELVSALQGTGLPVAPGDDTISSAGLTCLNRGEGLTVSTQNITRIPAAVYADALVTAGVGDASVLIAAPPSNPVTGETALVGALKAFPQCQAGQQPDPARVRLAYQQVARTVALAGPDGDLNKASTVLLKAGQDVITGQARDDAAIGAALDAAAASEGFQIPAGQRPETIAFLKQLSGLDYGTYARGYQIEQVAPDQVRVVPAGPGAPAGAPGAAGNSFSGTVTRAGDSLAVRDTNGQERQVNPAPGVTVIRDGRPATVADIRATDRVNVDTSPDGRATRIEATSTGAATTPAATPPAAAGAATTPVATAAAAITPTRAATTPVATAAAAPIATTTPAAAAPAPVAEERDEGGFNPLWLLPLLLLPLLLLPFLLRRRRDSFILERNAPVRTVETVEPVRTVETVEPARTVETVETREAPVTRERTDRPRQ